MKKAAHALLLASVLLAPILPASAAGPSEGGRTALRLSAGWSSLDGGDFSRGLLGWLDLWAHAGSLWGIQTDVTGGPGSWAAALGADVLFPLTSWLSFGMGAAWVSASDLYTSSAEGNGGLVPDAQSIEMTPRALPVRASLFGRIPLSGRLDVSMNAGVSYYYLARARAVYRRDWEDYWEEDAFDLKTSGLGYHGGLGLELELGRHVSVFVEGQVNRARLSKFFGTIDRASSEGGEESREGTLYALEFGLGDGETFPLVDVLDQAPAGPAFSRAAEAVIDFGGFGLAVGLLLRL
jgi:hypothetical protein